MSITAVGSIETHVILMGCSSYVPLLLSLSVKLSILIPNIKSSRSPYRPSTMPIRPHPRFLGPVPSVLVRRGRAIILVVGVHGCED